MARSPGTANARRSSLGKNLRTARIQLRCAQSGGFRARRKPNNIRLRDRPPLLLSGFCLLAGAQGEAAAKRIQSSVSPDYIKYGEQQCNEGGHVSFGNERPGSRPNVAKPNVIKQHGKFVVSQQPVAGKMFGGKPQP